MNRQWVHGEMETEDGYVGKFRYEVDCEHPIDAIPIIEGRYCKGSMVLWITGGFIPADKTGWDIWSMEEEFRHSEVVVMAPNVNITEKIDDVILKISSILS